MKINIYEPQPCFGHENYNRSLIALCANISDVVYCVAGDDLIKAFPASKHSISKQTLNKPKKLSRIGNIFNHFRLYQKAKKHHQASLFLSFNNTAMLISAILLGKCQQNIYLICHNNIPPQQRGSLFSKLSLRLLKFFGFKLILLENIFQQALLKTYHYPASSLNVVYHPVPTLLTNHTIPNTKNNNPNQITITYFSGLNLSKGVDVFLKAVIHFLKNNADNESIFFIIKLSPHVDYKSLGINKTLLDRNNIRIHYQNPSKEEYLSDLLLSDYICLPFRKTFLNRCSGIFFEAIALNKPLITSDTELFKHYQNQYGVYGEMFPEEDDIALSNIFTKVLQNKTRAQYPGIDAIKKDRSNEHITEQLSNIFK